MSCTLLAAALMRADHALSLGSKEELTLVIWEWASQPRVDHGRVGPTTCLACSDIGEKEMTPVSTPCYLQQSVKPALRFLVQANCPCPSPAAIFRRAGPTAPLGNTVELNMIVEA